MFTEVIRGEEVLEESDTHKQTDPRHSSDGDQGVYRGGLELRFPDHLSDMPIRVQYRPPYWSHTEPHSEEVEQFLAMLRFEQKSEVKKLSEVLM